MSVLCVLKTSLTVFLFSRFRYVFLLLIYSLFSGGLFSAPQQIVIHWSTDQMDGASDDEKDGRNSHHCWKSLQQGMEHSLPSGYFDQGSTANPFAGTGFHLLPELNLEIQVPGCGYPDGHFFATSIFPEIQM